MKKYTEKEIEDYLTEIFATRKKVSERKVIIYRACDYHGHIKGFEHCGNEDCRACNDHIKRFNEYVRESIKDFKFEPNEYDFSLLPTTKIKLANGKEIKLIHDPIKEEE